MLPRLAIVFSFLLVTACQNSVAAAPTSVRLRPSQGKLAALITEEVEKARARKLRPYLELRAEWCGPCKALEASMGDAQMVEAFAGTYVISVDLDEWGEQVPQLGFSADSIPVFYELDAAAKSTGRTIDGGAWGANTPANMAPPLKAFVSAGKG